MTSKVSHGLLGVREQREALAWYAEMLGLELRSDDPFADNPNMPWVSVAQLGQAELKVVVSTRVGCHQQY